MKVGGLEQDTREEVADAVQQFLALLRVGDVLHPLGDRPVGDDLRALEELVAPDVVRVLVRVDDATRHGGPHHRVHRARLQLLHHRRPRLHRLRPGLPTPAIADRRAFPCRSLVTINFPL